MARDWWARFKCQSHDYMYLSSWLKPSGSYRTRRQATCRDTAKCHHGFGGLMFQARSSHPIAHLKVLPLLQPEAIATGMHIPAVRSCTVWQWLQPAAQCVCHINLRRQLPGFFMSPWLRRLNVRGSQLTYYCALESIAPPQTGGDRHKDAHSRSAELYGSGLAGCAMCLPHQLATTAASRFLHAFRNSSIPLDPFGTGIARKTQHVTQMWSEQRPRAGRH